MQGKYFESRKKKARRILNELKPYVASSKKLKVLAVGGEYGFIEYHLAGWTSWDIVSTDIEKKLIMKYPEVKKRISVKVMDSTNMSYKDSSFDVVIFNHVMEHIPNWSAALDEIYRVLKPGGYLYLATPNALRKLVRPRIFLANPYKVSAQRRIDLHLGFAYDELVELLTPYSKTINLNKPHQCSTASALFSLLPEIVFKRYAQTNVFICQK